MVEHRAKAGLAFPQLGFHLGAFDTVTREADYDGKPYWRFDGKFGPMMIVLVLLGALTYLFNSLL